MYQTKWPLHTLSLLLLLLLSACGSYDAKESSGTGSIDFSISWQGAPTLAPSNSRLAPQFAPINCTTSGVSTVSATVYNSLNNSIATGGPWTCSAHSGTITNVPSSSGMKVVISGMDSFGTTIYRGEVSGITVTAGQTTSAGTIVMSLQGTVTTIAGSAGFSGSIDGTGSTARFDFPFGITSDGTNLYIVDNGNQTIRKVVISTGAVTTIAGSAGLSGSTDGTGSAARFSDPIGITTDGTNLFVSDFTNHTIRKIVISTRAVTTIAGSAGLSGSTDGTGSLARFNNPHSITTDGTNLFVTDSVNHTIRKIVISTGTVTTIAGSAGLSGSTDGTGSAARFYTPRGIITDGTNLFVTDSWNNTIRKIVMSTWTVSTIAGTAGSSGSTDGTGSAARFNTPNAITTDGTNLFVADSFNNTIRKIEISTGVVTTIAGSAGLSGSTDGTGATARFDHPDGITISGTNLFITDYNNHTVRKIGGIGGGGVTIPSAPTGVAAAAGNAQNTITWTAVTGATSYNIYWSTTTGVTTTTGTKITGATSPYTHSTLTNGTTYYYIVTAVNAGGESSASSQVSTTPNTTFLQGGAIQGISLNVSSTNATVTTIAGSASLIGSTDATGTAARFSHSFGITTDGTNLFVADSDNHTIRKMVISTGTVTTLAGSAGLTGSTDGTGTAARFNHTHSVTTDGTNLFVTDTFNHTIRKIVISTGVVTTIAGFAGLTGSTDGTGTAARFNQPYAITTDGTSLFVSDYNNNTIRRIDISTGVVTTIAGSAGLTGSTDGTGSAARFFGPIGITIDGTNLFVADVGNHTIRKIVISTSAVTTIAGSAGVTGSTDGTGTAARFINPYGLTTDGTNLFVAESGNHILRKIVISTSAVTTIAGSAGVTGSTDGTGTAARFWSPCAITTDGTNLFVADTYNYTIRKIQ